jgi:very-short-patch-repair endonuclease
MEPDSAPETCQAPSAPGGVDRKATSRAPRSATPIALLNGRQVLCADRTRWQVLGEIAAGQRNRASGPQLAAAGFSARMINTAVSRGEFHRAHRGVFVIGADFPSELGRETSALLVAPGLVLVGLSVLAAVGVVPPDLSRPVDVCRRATHLGNRPGVRVHRYGGLQPSDIRIVNGLPMTTVERALLDAADELGGRELERAVDEALAARLTSRTKLRETTERAVGRRGQLELLALADARRASKQTKREAAELALRLIRAAGLPEPQTEVSLFGYTADFFFAESGVVLEVDSFAYHGLIRSNFNRDRRKDRIYRQHGLEVVRVTADELMQTPYLFVSDLSAAITRRLEAKRAA